MGGWVGRWCWVASSACWFVTTASKVKQSTYNVLNAHALAGTKMLLPVLIPLSVDTAGECGGSVVECRTPEREVGGSKPTAAVLCP